jgi:hypothetical protein
MKRLSMTKTDSQTERPAGLVPGDVPFLGWSRAALEFRHLAAELAPGGFFRPLIIGDPGVGKRTMAYVWRRVSGQSPEERPIIDLDTWGDVVPHNCIAITARRPPPGRPCFRLDTGTWGETDGTGTLPADLMQRFSITIYMPPLHGQREIDALTYLDFCTKARFPSHRLYYSKIAADLIHCILFRNDWPANLAGLARSLRNLSYADQSDATQADPEYQLRPSCDTLRDRRPELGWFDRPGVGSGPTEGDEGTRRSAELVAWACGGDDIYAGWVPDVAVRLYTRLVQLRLAEEVGREGPDAGLRLTPPPGGSGGPRTDLTAETFLRLSEEQFARQFLLPGGAGPAEGGPEVVAGLRDRLRNHPVLGTDFAALQAGLTIDPVEADLPSYRVIAVNQVGRSRSTGRRTQAVGAPGQDPQAAGEASEPANRFCIEDSIFHVVFRGVGGGVEEGRFPRGGSLGLAYYRHLLQHPETGFSALRLEREIHRVDGTPERRVERATGEEGFTSESGFDPVLDPEGKRIIEKRLGAIALNLEKASQKGDRLQIKELEKEQRFLRAELDQAVHGLRDQNRETLAEMLRDNERELEEARNDGDPLVIEELEERRRSFFARVEKEKHGHKDKNLDKSAKRARDRVRKSMEQAQKKLIFSGMPGLAQYLRARVSYEEGWWTYQPQRTSRLWQT